MCRRSASRRSHGQADRIARPPAWPARGTKPMTRFRFSFRPAPPQSGGGLAPADAFILLLLAALIYAGARMAFRAPAEVTGPDISLSPLALPWYALLSVGRMAAAYVLSLAFSLAYAY